MQLQRREAVDPQTYNEAVRLFNRASAQIMCKSDTAFYSAMLMQLPIVWTTTVTPTAAVDAKGTLYLNINFVVTLSLQEMVFLLIHECEHLLGLHPVRLAQRNAREWNLATDAVINAHLKHDGIGKFIEGGVDRPEAYGKTADEMYNKQQNEDDPEDGDEGGDGGEDGEGNGPGGIGDDLICGDGEGDGTPMSPSELRECESKIKNVIANAAQACRVAGSLSADMQRRVNDILSVKTPWYEVLERFMQSRANTDYSWSRPNRRFAAANLTLPSMQSIAALGEVTIIRDVSGSIRDEEHNAMIGHFNSIIERCKPSKVRVLDVSSVVHHVHEFEADDFPINPEIMGGGGTDLRAGFDYANANFDDPDVMIVFTDGYTDWPSQAQSYPVVVLCTTDYEVNYGDEVVRYE